MPFALLFKPSSYSFYYDGQRLFYTAGTTSMIVLLSSFWRRALPPAPTFWALEQQPGQDCGCQLGTGCTHPHQRRPPRYLRSREAAPRMMLEDVPRMEESSPRPNSSSTCPSSYPWRDAIRALDHCSTATQGFSHSAFRGRLPRTCLDGNGRSSCCSAKNYKYAQTGTSAIERITKIIIPIAHLTLYNCSSVRTRKHRRLVNNCNLYYNLQMAKHWPNSSTVENFLPVLTTRRN